MTDFERYKQLKGQIQISYLGIDFSKTLAFECSQLAFNKQHLSKLKLTDILKFCYASKNVKDLADAFANNAVVLTSVYKRNDYEDLIDKAFKDVNNFRRVEVDSLPYKNRFAIRFQTLWLAIKLLFKFKGADISFKERTYLACRFLYQVNLVAELSAYFKDIKLTNKKYVAFNSAFDIESLFTLFFDQKGADTYHLSHALNYINFKREIPIDILNSENITAKKVLVWGESSKQELLSKTDISANHIFVAGNPKYQAKSIYVKNSFAYGVVFLARPLYDEGNTSLLKLIVNLQLRYNINFSIKAHPASQLALFSSVLGDHPIKILSNQQTIHDILISDEYDFAISYNTNAYFEAMYYNLICFRYAVGENEDFKGLDDKFFDEDSFHRQIKLMKSCKIEELNISVHKLLIENLGMGINRYGEILR